MTEIAGFIIILAVLLFILIGAMEYKLRSLREKLIRKRFEEIEKLQIEYEKGLKNE